MSKVAFVFPGQGSQFVGMGRSLAEQSAAAREVFERADEALGFSLSSLCFEGPEEELRLTVNTQPAILTTSVAVLAALREQRPDVAPDYVAGHSLGEYSALVAAESMAFADAVKVVRARGQFMEEAVPAGQGAMAAVLGMDRQALQDVCETVTASGHPVQPANMNGPGQIVISGTAEGVRLAGEQAKAAGAKRVLPLNVSGPFHSSLMQPAAERLKGVLANIDVKDARVPVVANVSARPETAAAAIVDNLVKQVAAPVLWEDSVRWMAEQGVTTFVEIGPGKVLAGLIKKIAPTGTTIVSVQDMESLHELLNGGVLC
ncbi:MULTISPECIES: ACP S-malonyltransferase [Bacillales]|jgi:[acyl-carrier-protein] S-malonyltransferase|uniref:ACP S-malonyltransferase n=1 Tax=Brevibacillus TaxID=55080 RepID=UPI000E36B727|nr:MULTISPECIES: ACP S-malonyltransferase [Bacillales]REK63058.1 MAG: [acyl-carrier-protein] S-malonyltransferase [Brevibacillus sp.]MBR8658313.1 ACP S-malonyltransferase [Brevibacillus sp. NL20B1]MDT3414654.1 [acyl-carrier-protein] S-malonyltransferase [Brevibacillus aydinogluensis]NNV03985.1 [acyl-carrier-protein] S-malonyltransferase [Brevibacillus sp. MCWH]UFJ61013.1 ACP S-malonyltransferase [Anoxybacillus sediminis]